MHTCKRKDLFLIRKEMAGPERLNNEIYSCTNLLMAILKSCCGSNCCKETENRQDEGDCGGRFDVWMLSANVI